MYDARYLGIDGADAFERCRADGAAQSPPAGWYAVSINHLRWWRHAARDARRGSHAALFELASMPPVAKAGHTIYLFHVKHSAGN